MAVYAAAAFTVLLLLLHVATALIALWRCRAIRAPGLVRKEWPRISVIRPVCGLEPHLEQTLLSSFHLDHRRYELIFCVANADDAALPLIRRLMAENPACPTRLLLGESRISENPKLNNVAQGWRAANADWILMADSNVLMPAACPQQLFTAWRVDTGLVCCPALGGAPVGFAAELECGLLNTYQVRWQYAVDTLGFGFAQGKTMLFRRDILDRAGGIHALACELAEDAAATKVVRRAGLRVRLADAPFAQPLGQRRMLEVWQRQVRWARLRRASFAGCYALEIVTGALVPLFAAVGVCLAWDLPLAIVPVTAAVWYGAEAILAYGAGWPLTVRSPLAWMLRDLLLPALWVSGWCGTRFVWRGTGMCTAGIQSRPVAER